MAVDWIPANTASSRSDCAACQVCGSRASGEVPTHNDICHCGEVISPDSHFHSIPARRHFALAMALLTRMVHPGGYQAPSR